MSEKNPGTIQVIGARENNLKNISVTIPRNSITVITGLSGSGKSSLAFDTIYAEGQRRYVESLSAYARNFLEQLKKPEVDSVTGLSPAIAIEQKTSGVNPRSTVGTVTEIYDYLRLLFARIGVPHCPRCKIPVTHQTDSKIVENILNKKRGAKIIIYAPVVRGKRGEFTAEFAKWIKAGYLKAKIDGAEVDITQISKLKKTLSHDIDLVIDRLILNSNVESRLTAAVKAALKLSEGVVLVETLGHGSELFSLKAACPKCGYSFAEIEPRFFSFNNSRGACVTCNGLGGVHKEVKIPGEDEVDEVFETCKDCEGTRLKPEVRSVYINEKNIVDFSSLSISKLHSELGHIHLDARSKHITEKIFIQINDRSSYLNHVGVSYLSLQRPIHTLSGGEAQRVRLATQIGSALVGVLYVLDEPSIGLHPRDHGRLLTTLTELKNRGNTVLLVEHDEDTIRMADHIIDIGPRAGIIGGDVIAIGTLKDIEKSKKSLTGQYLSGKASAVKTRERVVGPNTRYLSILGASGNNLKSIDVDIPLGTLTTVTGVSGSGKSTLVLDTLFRAASQHFGLISQEPSPYKSISGLNFLDKVIDINQKPIGRTPRSNPSTYTGLFSLIRQLFAEHPESKIRGYKPGRFSFNVKGGRCEHCMGAGSIKVDMHFMPDVFVTCEVCNGRRYNRETLNIKYKGKSIADILEMSVAEALPFFEHHKLIHKKLETLKQVGLDYITLGQSSTTLSGGEAQRVKLSKELSRSNTGNTLYILDEPTTGLHFDDVRNLIELLQSLVDQGNTVIVIEHNLDVIASSDYVIDLGPEGGDEGGSLLVQGHPRDISKTKASFTGQYLRRYFN